MRRFQIIVAMTMLAGLTACNSPPPLASTQMTPASAGSSAAAPQTANSLPRGDTVNGPMAAPTGNLRTTRP